MKKNILFITRNGLLEPLGQSQILSYLIPLSKEFSIHIISFEKDKDIENKEQLSRIKSSCTENNIDWTPLTYRKTFRSLGIIVGFIELFFKVIRVCKVNKIDCIHARSYYPAFIALLIYQIKKVPFIFDMRALWPDELVEAGRLKESSISWKIIKTLEKQCLKKAFAVVSLTHAAVEHLDKVHPNFLLKDKTSVIPTCANLERFKLKNREFTPNAITISCIGSMLSGWFQIDILKAVVDYMLRNYPSVKFEFLTRDNKEDLLSKIDVEHKWVSRIHIDSLLFKDMPTRLTKHDGSVFFFTANTSKLGSAPTRMAELLGTGIPVLTSSGVGDVDKIVLEHKVGIILKSISKDAIKKSCDDFFKIINNPEISKRCRVASEYCFSLEKGVKSYSEIYSRV